MDHNEKKWSCCETTACCESSGKGLIALLIIIATIANIGASYFFTTQASKAALEAEYAKMGGKENYDLLNEANLIQMEKQIPQIKQFIEAEKKNKPATNAVKDPTAPATPEAATQAAEPAKTEVKKSDKPTVELFIMSYCPYGLQAQKAFVPLIDKFKKFADINVKFVQYTMHGLKEGQENTRQFCIRNEQADKYVAYAECFVKAGDSAGCLKSAKVDEKKLEKCYTPTFEKFGGEAKLGATGNPEYPADKEAALAAWVQGSPTLVINGAQVNADRTQAAYAKAICDAFTDGKKPAVCSETFSSTPTTPSFDSANAGGSTGGNAGCGTN